MDKVERFQRQILFSEWGRSGQERIAKSSAVQAGCGALGSTIASCMVRAGIGRYTIIDKDKAEITNLHRQFLFNEADAIEGRHKAAAAAERLARADSHAKIEARPVELTAANAGRLLKGHDIVLDALDNMETRYLLNDWCVKNGVPWVYGAVAGASGMLMPVIPGDGPCLRCLFPDVSAVKGAANTATEGIVNTAPAVVAALQATEAFKILLGGKDVVRDFRVFDFWSGESQRMSVKKNPECPCCGRGEYEFLEA